MRNFSVHEWRKVRSYIEKTSVLAENNSNIEEHLWLVMICCWQYNLLFPGILEIKQSAQLENSGHLWSIILKIYCCHTVTLKLCTSIVRILSHHYPIFQHFKFSMWVSKKPMQTCLKPEFKSATCLTIKY